MTNKLITSISIAIKNALSDKEKPFCSAIITAAGSGSRMGGVSKQLIDINGKTLIEYSIEAFIKSDYIKEIVISAKKEEKKEIEDIASYYTDIKPIKTVVGGATRQESVSNAFFSLNKKSRYVAIHDGARPLLRTQDVDLLISEAIRHKAVSAGHRVTDTIKNADGNGFITGDLDRSQMWAVQTPQVFDTDVYRVALAVAKKNPSEVTDDNSLVSAAGFKVKIVDIKNKNFKLTTPEDMEVIEGIVNNRETKAEE